MDGKLDHPVQFQELHLQLQDLHIELMTSLQIGKQDPKECLRVLEKLEQFPLPTSMDVNRCGLIDSVARVTKYRNAEIRKKALILHSKLVRHGRNRASCDEQLMSQPRKSRRLEKRKGEGQDAKPEDYLLSDRNCFCIKVLPDKGRAVFTKQDIKKEEFLLNYRGEPIDKAEGDRREETEETGFRYFSEYKGKAFCIDATAEPTRVENSLGRLVNHGKCKETNCRMKVLAIDGQPRLCLYATKDIKSNTELLYDYGLPTNFKFPLPYHIKAIQESILNSSADNDDTNSDDDRDPDYVCPSNSDYEDSDTEIPIQCMKRSFPTISDFRQELSQKATGNEQECAPQDDKSTNTLACASRSRHETSDDPNRSPNSSECQLTSTSTGGRSYKKPYRYCIFCKGLFSKLRNHQENQHKNLERVRNAMKLGKTDRDNVFDAIRREGILEYNKQETLKNPDNPRFQRERKRPENCKDSSVVMCNICHAFIEKKYRYRHEQVHNDKSDAAIRVTPIPVSLLSRDVVTGSKSTTDSDYTTEVLSRFRMDEVGRKCVSDKLLVEVGKTMWYKVKSKKDKKVEVRRQVMTDIRRLATLHLHLQDSEDILGKLPEKEGTIIDLLKRSNFKHLQEAIDKHTTSGSDLKAGLKIALYYLLKSTSKILTGMFLINDEDDQADDISRFVTVLEMHQHLFFGDATYQQNKNREEKLRRPQEQPLEEDVQAVRSYSLQRMAELENEVLDSHTFIELRNIVVCRLVLFNARRGGEPTRLFIKDWEEADSNAWLDKRHLRELDAIDACLAKNLKVGYQSGKGKHLVPTLFPKDTHKAIGMLANNDVRQASGIASQNSYLFPSGNDSLEHVSGWHAVNAVSDKCSLVDKDLLTATRNRHRVSTEFAMMDVPPSEREFVYRHLGHSENTNVHVYQAPLAVRELTVVGRRLQDLDKAGEDDASEPAEVESEADGTFQPAAACTEEAEDAASHSVGVEEGENASKRGVRRYTHWSKECNKKTCEYFLKFIMGEASKKLPGKQEVEEFLKQNPDFPIKDWMIIRSKIMNEKRKREKR